MGIVWRLFRTTRLWKTNFWILLLARNPLTSWISFPVFKILNSFGKGWQKEYLTSLRERHNVSNKRFESTVKIGDVVLVHNDIPRLEWKLSVIEKLIISPDGEFRAAENRTAGGKTNHPISKLYPLEVTETIEISSPSTQSDSNVPVPATQPNRKAAIAAKERIRNMAEEYKASGTGVCRKYYFPPKFMLQRCTLLPFLTP